MNLIDKTSKESDGIHEKLLEFKLNKHGLENSLNNIKNTQIEIEEKIQSEEIKIKTIQENIAVESAEAKSLKEEEQSSTYKTISITNRLLILNNNIDSY